MIYEYSCESCRTRVDVSKPVAEMDKAEICVACKKPMQRLISLSSFQLKGDGWAKSGYASSRISFKKNGKTKTVSYESNKVPTK